MFAAAACLAALAAVAQEQSRAPFFATPQDVVERMLALAQVGADDVVVDLGSGDGRIVIAAARQFGARGVGIDLDASSVATARENARSAGVAERVRFIQGDVLTAPISQATVVTAYLLPDLMWRLSPRFIAELRPGTRVVSHEFGLPGWRPDRVETLEVNSPHPGQPGTSTLYLWIVPADVRGAWRSAEQRVTIMQSYQHIDVEGARAASLTGRDVAWESALGRFQGHVEGDRIVGRLEQPGGSRALTFVRER